MNTSPLRHVSRVQHGALILTELDRLILLMRRRDEHKIVFIRDRHRFAAGEAGEPLVKLRLIRGSEKS